jgi:hypothetical protein
VATTDDFDEWFSDLSEDGQAEIIAKVELLKILGPTLGRPHADTLNGSKHANMKELRGETAEQVLRVAFAFDPERVAILLVAGNKAGVGQKAILQAFDRQGGRLVRCSSGEVESETKSEGKVIWRNHSTTWSNAPPRRRRGRRPLVVLRKCSASCC